MLALQILKGEVVGVVLYRGPGKPNTVKSQDHRVRSRLFKLFNSSFPDILNALDESQCQAHDVTMAPGTTEHFWAVVTKVNANTSPDYVMSVMGTNDAD